MCLPGLCGKPGLNSQSLRTHPGKAHSRAIKMFPGSAAVTARNTTDSDRRTRLPLLPQEWCLRPACCFKTDQPATARRAGKNINGIWMRPKDTITPKQSTRVNPRARTARIRTSARLPLLWPTPSREIIPLTAVPLFRLRRVRAKCTPVRPSSS